MSAVLTLSGVLLDTSPSILVAKEFSARALQNLASHPGNLDYMATKATIQTLTSAADSNNAKYLPSNDEYAPATAHRPPPTAHRPPPTAHRTTH